MTLSTVYIGNLRKKNRKFYENNPRLALLVRSLDRLEPSRKKHIFIEAENFIKQNTI